MASIDHVHPRPVIFLDVDGVLAVKTYTDPARLRSYARMRAHYGLSAVKVTLSAHRAFVPAAIARFNDLCAATGALAVLSSARRRDDDALARLADAGVTAPFHPDWRTDDAGPLRSDEITRWLRQHGTPPFAVLDDWAEHVEDLRSHLVQPDYRAGLSADDCTKARELLTIIP